MLAFDLMFPGPSDDDEAFRTALDRYSDHVVIASNLVGGSLTRPSDTLIHQTLPIDSRIGFGNFCADDDEVVPHGAYFWRNLETAPFEVVVWSSEMSYRPRRYRSDLNFAIEKKLREAGIELAFPQRDLHIRSGVLKVQNVDAGERHGR